MANDTFVCPLCRKHKSREMYHCPDHCMDMCSDHVREANSGRFYCRECERPVKRMVHNGLAWELV